MYSSIRAESEIDNFKFEQIKDEKDKHLKLPYIDKTPNNVPSRYSATKNKDLA